MAMGDLARTDEYDPFAAEQFVNPVVASTMGALLAPRVRDENSPVEYTTASPLVNITTQDIADATDKAMAFSGGGLGIKAYHGSPHDFSAFDMSKIGTGEGAQAYGHGLYFAENEGVARGYRDALAKRVANDSGYWDSVTLPSSLEGSEMLRYSDLGAKLRQNHNLPPLEMAEWKALKGRVDTYNNAVEAARPKGSMYEVNINADPAHFLDWDKPLSQMSPEVQRAVEPRLSQIPKEYRSADPEGEYIWRAMHPQGGLDKTMDFSRTLPQQATERLREAGIPGIKYLDQGSRFAKPVMTTTPHGDVIASHYPPKSSNYVVFNDKLIDILRKYGIAGLPAGAAGMGALAAQDNYQPGGM